MNDVIALISRHGYALLALILVLEAIGFPMPAAIALLAAGSAVAYGKLSALIGFGVSVPSIVVGDFWLFLVGRHTGWRLLGFLCRISVNPESCILRSAQSFYRRGKLTLLFAKFIPGINTMAAPLAGSMKMRTAQFLRLDFTAACLYVLGYGGLGFLFSDFLRQITHGLRSAGRAMELIVVLAIAGYLVYRVWLYRRYRLYKIVPRVSVEEIARRLTLPEAENIMLVDVRSHGYYDPDVERIKGSIRIEPNNLVEEITQLSSDKEIYLYCT
jgi:membrane protein DedA with SNARE-associated domain